MTLLPKDHACAQALRELGVAGDGPLTIGGIKAAKLIARFGSPLYAFDAAVLARRVDTVRAAFGPRVQVLWSVKANPSIAVTDCLRRHGAGAEIASLGELHVALAAGHAAATLRFAGPGKTDAELAAALAAGLGCVHVESLAEVDALARLATPHGVIAKVAIRVNFAQELAGSRLRMGGKSSRFGIDEQQVPAVIAAIAERPSLRLVGLHAYAGTQCFDAAAFVAHCTRVCTSMARWEHELGAALDEIDLGGGFAVAAFVGDGSFDLVAAGAAVQRLLAEHDRAGRSWFLELGRYLAAPAGVYLTRVVRTKVSGDEAQAVLDGGLHHHAAATGLGSLLRRLPLLVCAEAVLRVGTPVTLGGPLCTPTDQFAEGAPMGPLVAGDTIAVLNAGAYGLTFSPVAFLSHPTPAEVLIENGIARLVRSRGEPRDALRGQRI